jgi:aspartyl-tRNA(Asn)/glutamyl-tRNA(Gln) amidotransferase subunit A
VPDVYATASELLQHYRARALSPVELTRAVLERIERHDPQINAFVTVDADAALAAAEESERRFARGEPRLLEGVPVSVKDLLPVRGLPTRRGSRTTQDTPSKVDAPAVARLREEGAVLLGKTTTSEFGLKGLGESPLTGVTRNPYHLSHSPGGSSAGAVAAVAAGFGPLALGTDGGGSIRVPSAYAGVVGLKPSFGRVAAQVPSLAGVPPHVGPITRSVEDTILLLRVLSRPDARDPWSLGHVPFQGVSELRGLRIAYSEHLGAGESSFDVTAAFAHAVEVFQTLGLVLEPAQPGFEAPAEILRILFVARAAETVSNLSMADRALLDPDVQRAATAGEQLSARDVWQAESARIRLVEQSAQFHSRYDLLLTPTVNLTAPLAAPGAVPDDERGITRVSAAAPFSLTRQPAISVPLGLSRRGLPIGLQIVGRHFEEDRVLAAALAFTQAAPFRERPPLG